MLSTESYTIDGRRVNVYTAGTGRPVMLLHGGGADSALISWGDLAEKLADRFRVYLPDWPGYGKSEPWDDTLRSDDLPRIVEELRIAIGIDKVALVGISMGGLASIGYALRYPSTVSCIALFGAGGVQDRAPFHGLSWLTFHMPLLGKLLSVAQWKMFAKRPNLLRSSLKMLLPSIDTVPEELVTLVRDELVAREDHTVFFKWQKDETRLFTLRTNYTARLSGISVPVLMMQGEKDLAAPARYARRAAELIPDVQYEEFPGAGHWLPREIPDRSFRLLSTFLNDHPEP